MHTIRSRLILYIALPTLILYVLILGGTLQFLRSNSLHELERNMTRMAANYAGRFDGFLREAAAIAETTAHNLGSGGKPTEAAVYGQLRANVSHAAFLYGACTAFEPGTYRPGDERFAPYVHRSKSGLVEMNISREVYDWYVDPRFTWFREPKAKGHGVWSAPYFDEGAGNVLMTTYSVPFYTAGEFRGVTTVDIDLQRLRETIGSQIADELDFVILTRDGHFIFDPRPERIMYATLEDIARKTTNHELAALIPRILSGRPGVATVHGWDQADKQWIFFAPIATTGWIFVARIPETTALAEVSSRTAVVAVSLSATLGLIIACIALVSSRLTAPLARLARKARQIAAGNLDARVDGLMVQDEIGELANDFNVMAGQLRIQIERLAAEEAVRRKTEHDLEIAREIQRSLLPVHHPSLAGYELAGWSQPADHTGGDYYDWQMLPNGNMAISLADVTGHGIGPALVTAVCRAYARATFPLDDELGRVLDRINDLLSDDLQAGRFITFVVALLEANGAVINVLSAGHSPLFLYRAAEDCVYQLPANNIPLGVWHGVGYGPATSITLETGDCLVLITDGFYEWPNQRGERFGIVRIENAIRAAAGSSASGLIEQLYAAVSRFTEGSEQPDDLTAVVLKRVRIETHAA